MGNLLQFIRKNHVLLLFILLEICAFLMIVQNNHFQRVAFINSTNVVTANTFQTLSNWKNYFSLKSANEQLALENAKLKTLISYKSPNDTIASLLPKQYIPAMVINNSVAKRNNYLTLDKGAKHGVEKGMGVVTPSGVVGIIKEVSEHFSSVLSVLHGKSKTSVVLQHSHYFGSLEWKGGNYQNAVVNDIPSHVELNIGDTIISSGYSSIYPADIPIGTISRINTKPHKNFHQIDIQFLEDFKQLKYVYITEGVLSNEVQELENNNE